VDRSGNVYISDASNDVIRMVAPGGIISTVAGNVCTATETTPCGAGYAGNGGAATAAQLNYPLGVAVDSAGNLYIADSNNNVIREVSGGTISGMFVSVHLNDPIDVAVDSANNLYIADINNNRIVKVTSAGIATVVAGNGTAGFSGDGGPASKA
jgi:DNA-binding beta-propeller fold protein YncE